MKKTLFDLSKSIFDEIVPPSTVNVDFSLSNKIEYAKIEFGEKPKVTIPIPITLHEKYYFEGNVFSNYDQYRDTIWSLFINTIYHAGAHIRVSNYDDYKIWCGDKTIEKCWNVINFVEDIKVDEYLKKYHADVWQNMTSIKTWYERYFNDTIQKHPKYLHEKFSKYSGVDDSKDLWRLKFKEIFLKMSNPNCNEITPYLNFLCKNQQLLPKNNLPYCDRPYYKKYDIPKPNMMIDHIGGFETIMSDLDDYWSHETTMESERLAHFERFIEKSNFDKIQISPENHGEFMRISEENSSDLKRLRNTLNQISFYVDSPAFEQIGLIEMSAAIQRVASGNEEIECFEQDVPKKECENWVVIFDNSASMTLRFDEMKKFIICLSETAEKINQNGGKWGLYSFNNKFLIVKDQKERYNQKIKARIGGLQSNGLSFISDAIDLGTKILNTDKVSANKYLIIVSDGKSLGTDAVEKDVLRSLEHAKKQKINLIGIGTPFTMRKPFAFTIDYTDTKKSVKQFIDNYSLLIESQ